MMKKFEDNLVVTVLLITYNSSKYVAETLESIKNQSYPYLSLVITDDCSKDKTLSICKKWLDCNRDRFVDVDIVESEYNTGISANVNRGELVCQTQWVKSIAGDDLLLPNCIEDNVRYVKAHHDAIVVFSRLLVFGADDSKNRLVESYYDYKNFSISKDQQLDLLITNRNFIPAPTCFYDVYKLRTLALSCDERIPLVEDVPRWINILNHDISFHFFDKPTVKYRISKSSLSNNPEHISLSFFRSHRLVYYYYQRDELIKKKGYDEVINEDVNFQTSVYEVSLYYGHIFKSKIKILLKNFKKRFLLW